MPIYEGMDVNQHPEFAETYAGIRRSFGPAWAKRFVLAAPLMVGDPTGPVYRAFVEGLAAHTEGAHRAEAEAWERCQALIREMAASLVAEAEAILQTS